MIGKTKLVPTDHHGLSKDLATGAVVATDETSLQSYKALRERMRRCDEAVRRVESLSEEFRLLKDAVAKIAEHVGAEVNVG